MSAAEVTDGKAKYKYLCFCTSFCSGSVF